MGSRFGVGAPPILEPILVGIGRFTGGTIWTLTHDHLQLGGKGSGGFLERRIPGKNGEGIPRMIGISVQS